MKCPKCRFNNSEGMKFSGKCGAKLEIICPQCNFSNLTEPLPINYSEPQSYTPKFLAEKIHTTRSAIEGERKMVSVLFADVINYIIGVFVESSVVFCNFSISSGRPAAPSANFFQYGQNLPLRAPNSDPRTGSKMRVSLNTNRLQSTIYSVRVTISRPKRLQTVARFEKKYRMTPLVGLTISF